MGSVEAKWGASECADGDSLYGWSLFRQGPYRAAANARVLASSSDDIRRCRSIFRVQVAGRSLMSNLSQNRLVG